MATVKVLGLVEITTVLLEGVPIRETCNLTPTDIAPVRADTVDCSLGERVVGYAMSGYLNLLTEHVSAIQWS